MAPRVFDSIGARLSKGASLPDPGNRPSRTGSPRRGAIRPVYFLLIGCVLTALLWVAGGITFDDGGFDPGEVVRDPTRNAVWLRHRTLLADAIIVIDSGTPKGGLGASALELPRNADAESETLRRAKVPLVPIEFLDLFPSSGSQYLAAGLPWRAAIGYVGTDSRGRDRVGYCLHGGTFAAFGVEWTLRWPWRPLPLGLIADVGFWSVIS